VILVFLGMMFIPFTITRRSPTARSRSDMRSISFAIESYGIDHSNFPPMNEDFSLPEEIKTEGYLSTTDIPDHLNTSLKYDGFYYYLIADEYWVLQSVGLDGDRDFIDVEQFMTDDFTTESLNQYIVQNTYDATNGTGSSGDFLLSGISN